MTTKPIILDTDIGTDVDDCLALALCLASSELKLTAVTTVYGDARLRARMVLKLLALRGVDDVPVAAGAEKPLLDRAPIYWEGHEGQGLLAPEDSALTPVDEHASDLIARTVMAQPGEIILIAIGPLTNVALAMLKEPRLPRALGGLVIMGGVIGGTHALHLPEAAQIVLASGAPMAIVPLDVTTQVRMRTVGVARLAAAATPFHLAVADQVRRYPRYKEQGWTYLHDPLAVASVIRPELVKWESLHAVVETGGAYTAGKLLVKPQAEGAPATAEVALGVSGQVSHLASCQQKNRR
jgi:purine nucleosidase